MQDRIKRFCPSCGAKVSGEERIFASPRECPRCKMVVWFSAQPKDSHPESELESVNFQSFRSELTDLLHFLSKNLGVILAIGFGIAALTFSIMLVGKGTAAVILALLFMFGAFAFCLLYFSRRPFMAAVKKKNARCNAVLEEYTELKRNFDAVIGKERARFESVFDGMIKDEKSKLENDLGKKIKQAEQRETQARQYVEAVDFLGKKFLDESKKWVVARLTPDNFVASKEKLLRVIQHCRDAGYPVSSIYENDLISELKSEYEMVVRQKYEREEQARIKERIREEQRAQKEFEREIERAEAEKRVREKALQEALERVKDTHSAEIEVLRTKLQEAEEKLQRTKSMAEMTKAGHIYVISNTGSFGENVFKIGMTRRLEPMDRVKELGDASVPFPFDVHMMIHSDNAPALEFALHDEFHKSRVNKVNMHKEFFRVDFESIRKVVERLHGEVNYVADADALQYKQSIEMSDEDYQYISEVEKKIDHNDIGGED